MARRDDPIGDMGHDYDGIRELDTELPEWWVVLFVVTVLFGLGYWLVFHSIALAPGSVAELDAELAAARAAQSAAGGTPVSDAELVLLAADPVAVAQGQEVFREHCVACHGPNGAGVVGPNLTDAYWLHGSGGAVDIRKVVTDGVVQRGMAAWGPTLGAAKIDRVVAWVAAQHGKELAGKAPEGTKVP